MQQILDVLGTVCKGTRLTEPRRGSFGGAMRIPPSSSLFLLTNLELRRITGNSLKSQSSLFSIPTAPTNHPIC